MDKGNLLLRRLEWFTGTHQDLHHLAYMAYSLEWTVLKIHLFFNFLNISDSCKACLKQMGNFYVVREDDLFWKGLWSCTAK